MVDNNSKYAFSFTSADLKLQEMIKLARYIQDESLDINDLSLEEIQGKIMDSRSSTNYGKRVLGELKRRILCLNQDQRDLLAYGTPDEKRHIAYYSICKLYMFVRDFVLEVLKEKVFLLDFQVMNSDINSFINRKREIHGELDSLSATTMNKSIQVLIRMLVQAKILSDNNERMILPQLVSNKVVQTLSDESAEIRAIFL